MWELEAAVNNGGFDAYLRYTDSDVIAYAPTALEAIGAHACRAIVKSALQILEPLPSTREEREDALDALSEPEIAKLEALDNGFYEYPDDLTSLLYAFVVERPEVFGKLS